MLEIGSIIDGKYKILNVIGKGGMSVVYLAMNERANKQWACLLYTSSTLLFSHKLTKSKRLYFVKKRNKRDYKSNNINAIFCKYYKFRGVLI